MSDRLAIVLPGRAYTGLGPAIRIPVLALEQRGFEVHEITYPDPPSGDEESWQTFAVQTKDRIAAVRSERQVGETVFVAKSLGTAVLARVGGQLDLPRPRAIWLTPLFRSEPVRDGAIALGWPALLATGTGDKAHDPVAFDHVATALGAETLLIEGADHGLEVPGDVAATVAGLARLAQATLDLAS